MYSCLSFPEEIFEEVQAAQQQKLQRMLVSLLSACYGTLNAFEAEAIRKGEGGSATSLVSQREPGVSITLGPDTAALVQVLNT